MKALASIITGVLILLSSVSFAQTKTNVQRQSVPAKGYYSIYTNAEKLPAASRATLAGDTMVRKGYFSVGENHRELARDKTTISNVKTTPIKGYYSIGTNAKKL